MKSYIQRTQQDEGFTLIELLIVIVVIGVLAGIVLFGTATFRADSVTACQDANQRVIDSAQAAYGAKNDGDTATTAELVTAGYMAAPNAECTPDA